MVGIEIENVGPNNYRVGSKASPGDTVPFTNSTEDEVKLTFYKQGKEETPFEDTQPYVIASGLTLDLIVKKGAAGKYRYDVSGTEAEVQFLALVGNPEMIIE